MSFGWNFLGSTPRLVIDKVFATMNWKIVYSSKQEEERAELVHEGAWRGLYVPITPGATQRNDALKGRLDVGTGKQQPHLDQFAIIAGLDWDDTDV